MQRRDAPSSEWPADRQGDGPAAADASAVRVDHDTTVAVLLPLPLGEAYDYRVPPSMALAPGDFVAVPLGKRILAGVVWGKARGDVDPGKLRDVERVLPAPPMSDPMRRFVAWVAAYTLSPPGAVLRMAMSVTDALEAPRTETVYRLAPAATPLALEGVKLTPSRRRVLDFLHEAPALPLVDVARQAGVGAAVVKALVDAGWVEAVQRRQVRVASPASPPFRPTLSEAKRPCCGKMMMFDSSVSLKRSNDALRCSRLPSLLTGSTLQWLRQTVVPCECIRRTIAAVCSPANGRSLGRTSRSWATRSARPCWVGIVASQGPP